MLLNLCVGVNNATAQLVDNGQNPPGLDWKEMRTPSFRILFPEGSEDDARNTANLLEYLQRHRNLRVHAPRTPVILQNQTVVSNGFVSLAPRRAELYTVPSQQSEPGERIARLAVHELRHLAQIDRLIRTKKVRFPLIQELQFALFGASMPVWLIEGDAVITETALTAYGRGFLPEWEKEFRANMLEGREYSYSKYFLGSLKDRVPDYYRMGYFMGSYVYRHFGDSLYEAILDKAMHRSPLPGAYSSSLKHYTGLNNTGLFKATVEDLKAHWSDQKDRLRGQVYRPLNRRRSPVASDYLLPHFAENGSLICLRRGLGEVPAFIRIDSAGNEQVLLKIGPQVQPHFDYAAGILVWDELKYDARYRYRDYSVINCYDTRTGRYRQLSRRSRLFAPSLSSDGTRIVAVKVGPDQRSSLVILDSRNGAELWESGKFDRQLHTPSFDDRGERIVFMLSGKEGRSMALYYLKGGADPGRRSAGHHGDTLTPRQELTRGREDSLRIVWRPDYFDSAYPVFAGEQVIFHSYFNGIGNVYALDLETGAVRQLSRARHEAAFADYDPTGKRVIFNDFVPEGMNIAMLEADSLPRAEGLPENTFRNYSAAASGAVPDASRLADVPVKDYPVRDYRGPGRLFNFHSIGPIAGTHGDEEAYAGLALKSHNLLNTFSVLAGYQYNLDLESGEYRAGLAYKKFYPILSLDYLNRMRRASTGNASDFRQFSWREHEVELGLSVPLSFTRRNYLYAASLSLSSSYTSRYDITAAAPANLIRKVRFPLVQRLSFTRQQIRSARDVAPRFAQSIALQYRSLPFDPSLEGQHFAFRSLFHFPGLFRHHSLSISYNFQEGRGQYRGLNDIPEISGASQLERTEALESTLMLNYRFPLAFPDWELGTFAYIKRIKAGFFADYENPGLAGPPDSFGLELRADAHFFRFLMPEFDIGTKVVFFHDKPARSPVLEWILTYNISL